MNEAINYYSQVLLHEYNLTVIYNHFDIAQNSGRLGDGSLSTNTKQIMLSLLSTMRLQFGGKYYFYHQYSNWIYGIYNTAKSANCKKLYYEQLMLMSNIFPKNDTYSYIYSKPMIQFLRNSNMITFVNPEKENKAAIVHKTDDARVCIELHSQCFKNAPTCTNYNYFRRYFKLDSQSLYNKYKYYPDTDFTLLFNVTSYYNDTCLAFATKAEMEASTKTLEGIRQIVRAKKTETLKIINVTNNK